MKIDLSNISEELRSALLPVLTEFDQRIADQAKLIEQGQGSGDAEELAALKAEVEDLREQIAEAKKPAKSDDKSKSKAGSDDDPGDSVPPALQARLDEMSQQIAKMTEERDGERQSAAAVKLAQQTVEARYPGLNADAKKRMINRIASAKPADAKAAEASADEVADEWRTAGVAVQAVGADSDLEGKTKTPEPGSKEEHIQKIRESKGKASTF